MTRSSGSQTERSEKTTFSLAVDSRPFDDIVQPLPIEARRATQSGGMAERFNAPVLKTGDPQGSVGSNPTPSAKEFTVRRLRFKVHS